MQGCSAKPSGYRRFFKFEKGIFVDVPHTPLIQHIEIAWVDTAIRFYQIILGAASAHGTVFRLTAHQNSYIVIKIADTDKFRFFEGLIVDVKTLFQKGRIVRHCQGMRESRSIKRVQTGNVLEVSILL